MREQPARLVFVDETAVTTKMTKLRGRSRRGRRLPGAAPFGHWLTQTFVAALRCDALAAPWWSTRRWTAPLSTPGLLFLPPYSPDLNPIEMAFAKLKAHLRDTGARSFDALWSAVGKACDLFSPQQCWNFCKAAGYASD